jgi:hypothetical protein
MSKVKLLSGCSSKPLTIWPTLHPFRPTSRIQRHPGPWGPLPKDLAQKR